MKKFYSSLMLASIIAASASAAAPLASDMQRVSSFSTEKKAMVANAPVEKNVATRANGTRAISSVDDICGPYTIGEDWWYPLSGPQTGDPSFFISKVAEDMVEISVSEMAGTVPLLATVNVAAGTITIKADDNKNLYPGQTMELETRRIDFANNGQTVVVPSVTGTIEADGTINLQDAVLLWSAGSGEGYYFGVGFIFLNPVSFFSYNASDWTAVGKAKFTDGFLNPAFKPEYQQPEMDVDLYKSKVTDGEYLLMNPYGGGQWPEILDDSTTGYIVFNVSNPDCVTMAPLVNSGAILDMRQSESAPADLQELCFYNNEGYKLFTGMSTEAQVEEVEEAMNPFTETIADYLSVYDADTRTVSIRNGMFGLSNDPFAAYIWTSIEQSVGLTAKIVLPGEGGVADAIINSDAPVKFYNLQGMEVANPEAGQIVIKKQGSKTVKVIAE